MIALVSCGIGVFAIAFSLEAFKVAPVALIRYVSLAIAPMMILAAFSVASFRSRLTRVFSAIALALIACSITPYVQSLVSTKRIPILRTEDWKSPIDQINQTAPFSEFPVLQFANVLEDIDANTNQDATFQDYLLFPVRSAYPIQETNRQVIPLPTLAPNPFEPRHLKLVSKQGGCWLLVRSTPSHAHSLSQTLTQQLPRTPKFRISEFSSSHSNVLLFLIEL